MVKEFTDLAASTCRQALAAAWPMAPDRLKPWLLKLAGIEHCPDHKASCIKAEGSTRLGGTLVSDEAVAWKYYLATGITAVIACFLSAMQGDTGIFFRMREILIMMAKTDVHPLWVFVPAFLLGLAACWVERPQNSRSVLIAGLASFSLFGFTPYSTGKKVLKHSNRTVAPGENLLVRVEGLAAGSFETGLIIRDADFQIVQRVMPLQDEMRLRLEPAGTYWIEVSSDELYRHVIYPVRVGEQPVELIVALEKLGGWASFVQKFKPATREDRQP